MNHLAIEVADNLVLILRSRTGEGGGQQVLYKLPRTPIKRQFEIVEIAEIITAKLLCQLR